MNRAIVPVLSAALLVVGLAGCSSADGADSRGGPGSGSAANPSDTGSTAALSAKERDELVFTREEEKLARDVYAALERHDGAFANIGQSEQTHMDAVGVLLTRYGVADPAAGRGPGEFSDRRLAELYVSLVATGQGSRLDALRVGVEIEELDIHDIEGAKVGLGHSDVAATYENLLRGSRNHLRSFYGKLLVAGGSYTPRHLDAAAFRAIVESPTERGP